MRKLWAAYSAALVSRPIFTNTVTASVVAVLGDLAAQRIETSTWWGPIDATRSLQVFVWGAVSGGAPMFWWYRFLDRRWPNPPTLRKVLSKVATNQFLAAPIMNSLFFGYTQLVQFGPKGFWGNWQHKLREDLLDTIKGSLAFWGPVHIFNFYVIPPHFRVLYLSVGLVAWTSFISMKAYKDGRGKHVAPLPQSEL